MRKLLTMLLCMISLAIHAQIQLVTTTTSGTTEKFDLEASPIVTFNVRYGSVGISVGDSFKELDIKSLHLENVPADSKLKVLINVDGHRVFIPITELKSIVAASFKEAANHLPNIIAEDPAVSIYNEALRATHMNDSLLRYMDVNYGFISEQAKSDSCSWKNNMLVKNINSNYDNCAYPEKRYYKYTALLVPDAVLKDKYNITSLDDLRQKAHALYDPIYPEDASVNDETDRRNALNRFISYHLLPFYGSYYKLTAFDNGRLQYNFNREKSDICDWYETMMPHSVIKFSFPSGTDEGLYVNRRGVQSGADDRGVFVRGALVTKDMPLKPIQDLEMDYGWRGMNIAENGIYHYIDDIVAYDETMQKVVCNDRMRIDCTTLSPDFMTSGARGHSTRVSDDDGKYGQYTYYNQADKNPNTCLAFKNDFMENIELIQTRGDKVDGSDTYGLWSEIHVRNRYLSGWSYQGDEVIISGERFDVKMKLPPLPAGKYELRLGTAVGFSNRGHINLYIDDELKGDNIDFRPGGSTYISPYGYLTEQTYLNGTRVTRYYLDQQNLVWMDEALLDKIEKEKLVKNSNGWGISASWRESAKEQYELATEKEVEDLFKSEIISALFKKNDLSLYQTARRYWQLAQSNPDIYIFEGNEPIDPYDERMDTYYNNLIDWTTFFKLGPVKYFDKLFHDKGWMRGAGDYHPGPRDAFDDTSSSMRKFTNTRRRVIGTFETDGKTNHYLRLQQQDYYDLVNYGKTQFPLDYIELIPVDLIENENIY